MSLMASRLYLAVSIRLLLDVYIDPMYRQPSRLSLSPRFAAMAIALNRDQRVHSEFQRLSHATSVPRGAILSLESQLRKRRFTPRAIKTEPLV